MLLIIAVCMAAVMKDMSQFCLLESTLIYIIEDLDSLELKTLQQNLQDFLSYSNISFFMYASNQYDICGHACKLVQLHYNHSNMQKYTGGLELL
jgi:hypothetical protein